MTASTATFPVPFPSRDTQPFWDAVAASTLVIQHCAHCGKWVWLPTPICPGCGRDELVWEEVSGRAQVVSWTVPYPPVLPAFTDLLPFYVLLVQLDEGPRLIGQLVDPSGELVAQASDLAIGRRVTLAWRTQGEQRLPSWTLAS